MFPKFQPIQLVPLLFLITVCASQRNGGRRRPQSCESLNTAEKEYLLDYETQRCYLVGSRGPCGELMTFYKHPFKKNSRYGFCDCDQGNVDTERPCKDSPIRRRVYAQSEKRCFSVFSQGPCKGGEWLVLNDQSGQGACVPNQCLSKPKTRDTGDQFWFHDPARRQCYQTYSQGYCPTGQQLELVHDSQYPVCKAPTCSTSLAYGIRSVVSCQTGTRFSFLTRRCSVTSSARFFGIG